MPSTRVVVAFLMLLLVTALPSRADAQWSNRYPRLQGYGHHVYLEGYELPTLAAGPTDPAPAPDGVHLAFSARGWIWILDLTTGEAVRRTDGPHMDFRPAWSPDGSQLAFVRDSDHDTWIVVMDASTGEELHRIDTPALDLDPVFTPDGTGLLYSSAAQGTLDLWRFDLESGARTALTDARGLQLKPQPVAGDDGTVTGLVYLAKGGGLDRVVWQALGSSAGGGMAQRDAQQAAPVVVASTSIASMARPALAPDGRTIALNWPTEDGWELRLFDVRAPGRSVRLTDSGVPLTPAWSPDGEWIYFGRADTDETMRLYRIPAVGGRAEEIAVRSWDWGQPTATLRIRTAVAGDAAPAAARLVVQAGDGHPYVPEGVAPFFEGQSGRVFFYSPGVVDLLVPAGTVQVTAVQGLLTPPVERSVSLAPGQVSEVHLDLEPVWDPGSEGWMSADHHFHLNYGGPYHLAPGDLLPLMAGEALDVATPLVANLHNRFDSQELWGWQSPTDGPLIRFGQEIRSHFLGHIALIETQDLYWPWVWGPGYQVYGRDDRTNGEVLQHAHAQGGLGFYVHPVSGPDPFTDAGRGRVPVELIADAVLGDVDALELLCLWSSAPGTVDVWHRLLNLGLPVAPSAGTDVMTNFYRTMAVGVTRVYAFTDGERNWPAYLDAYRTGRSFVTNGPAVDFQVGGAGPGQVLVDASGNAPWTLDLRSAVGVERVEVLVNGEVVWSDAGLDAPGRRTYQGSIAMPEGGWIAARATGGDTEWPAMDMIPYAHTGPVWVGQVGSTEATARRQAAQDLLFVLEASEARLLAGYAGVEIPRLRARFSEARERLEALAR